MQFRAGQLSLAMLRQIHAQPATMSVSVEDRRRVADAAALVDTIVARGEAAYGINTGFGLLAQTRIAADQLELLQRNLLLSHAAGIGEPLPDAVVRLIAGAQDQFARSRAFGHQPRGHRRAADAAGTRRSIRSYPDRDRSVPREIWRRWRI